MKIDTKKFISFEGLDFSGKSTQIELLTKSLKKIDQSHIIIREPGGTTISEQIRDVLLDNKNANMTGITEFLLYSAARNQLINEKIIPALNNNIFVCADRFFDSSTAYQGYGRGLTLELIHQIHRIATQGLKPYKTFFLDIPIETWISRLRNNKIADRLETAGINFFKRVRQGYLEIAEKEESRFIIIDGTQNIPDIHNEIWEIVAQQISL